MKIAIAGKGGVGKSTISALIARCLSDEGERVLLVDADPDTNLSTLLGIEDPSAIRPICGLEELIADRTGTDMNESSPLFRMNPKVDDIPDDYCVEKAGIKLIVMGTIARGGGGCACAENAFVKSLVSHMILGRKEHVVMDMEAGIEHLGRGTAIGVDALIVVAEPSRTSLNTAMRIKLLACDLGIKNIRMIGNKIRSREEEAFIVDNSNGIGIAGFIPYQDEIREMNRGEKNVFMLDVKITGLMKKIIEGFKSPQL
jgi:CO dehydrogenase maturation factor